MRGWTVAWLSLTVGVSFGALPWWDGGVYGQLSFRVPVEVVNGPRATDECPVTVEINFTEVLLDLGVVGALDEASIRVIRAIQDSTELFGAPLSYIFEKAPDFASISRARGWLSWITDKAMAPHERVIYHVYFDVQAHGVYFEPVPLSWEALYYHPANIVHGGSFEPVTS